MHPNLGESRYVYILRVTLAIIGSTEYPSVRSGIEVRSLLAPRAQSHAVNLLKVTRQRINIHRALYTGFRYNPNCCCGCRGRRPQPEIFVALPTFFFVGDKSIVDVSPNYMTEERAFNEAI